MGSATTASAGLVSVVELSFNIFTSTNFPQEYGAFASRLVDILLCYHYTPRMSDGRGPSTFESTQWSMVLAAGHSSSADGQAALEVLCRTYWYPLYFFLRRRGASAEVAEDQTQSFFAHMLDRQDFRLADRERGKFRSFLLTALKNFVANEHRNAQAQKRGGGAQHLSLDFELAEGRYTQHPDHKLSPEKLFERSWAIAILDRSIVSLETEWKKAQKSDQFALLSKHLLKGDSSATYGETGIALDMSEGAVKTAVYRLRKRYREILRNQIAQTVASEDEVDQEMRDLFAALSS
jgi:RNA polymerase sigma-70 factor (ECF subfamily)